jgi:hypothetical protein
MDKKAWALAWARFDSLRENPPLYWNENEVMKYNAILKELEQASGENLSAFQVAENEFKMTTWLEADEGAVKVEERTCDNQAVHRKMEGVVKYFQYLQPQAKAKTYGF